MGSSKFTLYCCPNNEEIINNCKQNELEVLRSIPDRISGGDFLVKRAYRKNKNLSRLILILPIFVGRMQRALYL